MSGLYDVLDRADDFIYEEDIARNPYSIRHWWTYVQAKRESPAKVRTPSMSVLWPLRPFGGLRRAYASVLFLDRFVFLYLNER